MARTWREMDVRSDRLAAALQALGIRKGDTTAILSHNRVELAEHWFACLKAGFIRAGVNWRYSLREKLHTIRDCNARVIIVEASCEEALKDHYEELIAEGRIIVGLGAGHRQQIDFDALIASTDTAPHVPELADDDIAMLGYTSGTTGNPKGVILSQKNCLTSVVHNAQVNGYTKSDVRIYVTNPAGININGMCMNLVTGMTTVVDDYSTDRFLGQVEEHRVTTVTLVPTMLGRLIDQVRSGHHDVSSVRQIAYGTMPATPALIRNAYNTFGCTFINRYGASESTGAIAALDDDGHKLALSAEPELLLSVGKSMPHAEVSVRDDDGAVLPFGELGTVWIRSDAVMQGYLNLPDETAQALRHPWLRTGDFGRMDDRGFIFLGDRKNHMIVSGGFNVYPIVVENALAEHPAVREAVVVGVPHPEWGEAIVAAVTLYPTPKVSAEELIEHCRPRLSKFEVPKHIEIFESLPTGNTDKLNKREVQARLARSERLPWAAKLAVQAQ
ncbi:MAG: AMP-binding protein [Phenylobacterium sp.]|nr:AMP-binding protein [Phenylobacterium sp.]MCR5879858.1 AMP-binding protein [Phenylobacterium sp. J367]